MRKELSLNLPAINLLVALVVFFVTQLSLNAQFYLSPYDSQQINNFKKESRFDEALVYLDSVLFIVKENGVNPASIEVELIKADIYRMKGFNDKADSAINSLLTTNDSIFSSCELLMALLCTIRGTIYLTSGELKKGRTSIDKAIRIYSNNLGIADTILGPCFNKMGNYYYFSKIYDSAMFYYSKALSLADMKKNNMGDCASYIQNKGIIYLELGDYENAENCFLESLHLKESLYPPNSFSLGRIYLNIGKFYQGISSIDNSFLFLDKAEKIFSIKGIPAHIELGKIYWNKGLLFYLVGDYDLALTYLFNARQIIDSVFIDNKQLISSLNADLGNVYKSSGQYKKAIKYYNLSLAEGNFQHNVKTYRNLANLHYEVGEYSKAEYYYQKLIKESYGPDSILTQEDALTFLRYGDFLTELNIDSAILFLDKAYEIYSRNSAFHSKDVASSLNSIGFYYFKHAEFDKALKYIQESLICVASSFTDTNVLKNPPLQSLHVDNLIISILSNKAGYLSKSYTANNNVSYLIASCHTYLLCMDIIEQLRVSYKSENSQLVLTDDIYEAYYHAIDQFLLTYSVTHDVKWLEHAFEISERGKAMVLLNEFRDANAKKLGIIPEDMGIAEKEIKKYLYLYRNQVWEEDNNSEPDLNKINYLSANLLIYERKYDSLIAQFKKNYPAYAKLKYDNSIVTVKKLQSLLEDNEIVIEYTLADEFVYIFRISSENFIVRKVEIDSTLVSDIYALRENLDFKHVPDYSQVDFLDYQITANNLYNQLILPVSNQLEGKKLIIIPDGQLNYLSFESLIEKISLSDSINFRDLPYLIKKCSVTYAASATILSIIKKGNDPELTTGVLAIAPSFNLFTRGPQVQNESVAKYYPSKMDLPGATWEVETILGIMAGKKLTGENATESEFKKLASSYDILHFATHTRIDDENPLSSTLSFYPFDGCGEDGVLHTYEIYSLDLKGELAVLSACSTGNGKLQKGEGVISLARAFTFAGVPSVVMTLWDVDDISSGNILPSFYDLLLKGHDKDAALRFAKLNYLQATKSDIETHPAFWSGIVLYGNNRGFRKPSHEIYIISLLVLSCLLIFVALVLVKKYTEFRKNIQRIDIDPSSKFQPEDRF